MFFLRYLWAWMRFLQTFVEVIGWSLPPFIFIHQTIDRVAIRLSLQPPWPFMVSISSSRFVWPKVPAFGGSFLRGLSYRHSGCIKICCCSGRRHSSSQNHPAQMDIILSTVPPDHIQEGFRQRRQAFALLTPPIFSSSGHCGRIHRVAMSPVNFRGRSQMAAVFLSHTFTEFFNTSTSFVSGSSRSGPAILLAAVGAAAGMA